MIKKNYYKLWINDINLPANILKEIKKYSPQKIEEAFAYDLEFGTAGLRAKIGYGSAFFNVINVRRATMAFAQFLQTRFTKKMLQNNGVLIGHDSRKYSDIFAIEAANILCSLGIKATLFSDNILVPTPLVSYGIRKLNFVSGIVITASHNSKEYNGFKIIDENGCQYLPEATNIISKNYNLNFKDSTAFIVRNNSDLTYLNNDIINQYINDILQMQYFPNQKRIIKIIFSNLHGTSQNFVPKLLKQAGYKYICVKEQYNLDPQFKFAPNPNPELIENFDLAYKYAKKNIADLIILNDPDADRIGVAVLHNKNYQIINTNDLAVILLVYIIEQLEKNKLTNLMKKGIIYNTVVSSDLPDLIAQHYNIEIKKTLTGFKWIGSEIEKNGISKKLILAFEESCGFILNDMVHDKDGIQTALIVAEAADFYKKQNKTFVNILDEVYEKFGYFYCKTVNKIFDVKDKTILIENIMKKLRNMTNEQILNFKIVCKEDYINGLNNMPSENLIKFYFDTGSWFAVRPSGTEPKIKFYFVFKSKDSKENAIAQLETIEKAIFKMLF